MEKEIGVVVGTGKGDHAQEELIEAITDEGFSVLKTDHWWPRDSYVFFAGNYVRLRDLESSEEWNCFGEGGYFQIGDDFLIISDRVYEDSGLRKQKGISRKQARKLPYGVVVEAIEQECQKHHPNGRIHVAPSGEYHGGVGIGHKHIDMFTLLLPKSKVLIVDTHFGGNAALAYQYDIMAESEGLKLIRYDGSKNKVQYPLNTLVLPKKGNDLVFIDQEAVSLADILSKEGIRNIGVKIPFRKYETGKIHCQTNVFHREDVDNVREWFRVYSTEYIEPIIID